MTFKCFRVQDLTEFMNNCNLPPETSLAVQLSDGKIGLLEDIIVKMDDNDCYPTMIFKIYVR